MKTQTIAARRISLVFSVAALCAVPVGCGPTLEDAPADTEAGADPVRPGETSAFEALDDSEDQSLDSEEDVSAAACPVVKRKQLWCRNNILTSTHKCQKWCSCSGNIGAYYRCGTYKTKCPWYCGDYRCRGICNW